MREFSSRTRTRDVSRLDGKHVECLIVGGGIVGAGIANILSQNGVGCILSEKGDFASGTSSGSSKLIHGGIRYLAQGHIRLTLDLLRERNYLIENTDLVKRLDFDIIVDDYSWSSAYMRLGLFLYSLLGGKFEIPERFQNNGKYSGGVRGYFHYFDGVTDDSTLVMHNIISAHENNCICLNYAEVVSLKDQGDKVEVKLLDRTNSREISFTCDLVMNCTGAWSNSLLKLYRPQSTIPLRMSKGVHIAFERGSLPLERAVTFRSHLDRRQMFLVPRGNVTIVGTTESPVSGPEDLEVAEKDVEYLLNSARRLFPGLKAEDVVSSYSGIRPLIGKGHNLDKVSRNFSIFKHGRMITVAGVKLTDYRNAARKAAVAVGKLFGRGIRVSGLPKISYNRPKNIDDPGYFIKYECAIKPEDITRRRLGIEIYDPRSYKEVSLRVRDAFERMELGDYD